MTRAQQSLAGRKSHVIARSASDEAIHTHPGRHSGAQVKTSEPGIHKHHLEYGFRVFALRRIPE
jgi:hypothetical protein